MCWGCFCCLFSLGSHVNIHVTTKGRNPEVCEMNINIVNHAIFPGDHLSTIINILSYYILLCVLKSAGFRSVTATSYETHSNRKCLCT